MFVLINPIDFDVGSLLVDACDLLQCQESNKDRLGILRLEQRLNLRKVAGVFSGEVVGQDCSEDSQQLGTIS